MALRIPLRNDGSDDPNYSLTVEIDPHTDELEARGFCPQNDTSDDDAAGITRDAGGNLVLKDSIVGEKKLVDLSGGRAGQATVDFGSNEADSATVTIPALWVTVDSIITATLFGGTTTDHDPDDVWAEDLHCTVGNVLPGESFDVTVIPGNGTTWGKYLVNWRA